jgi:ABC-type polar amino acid transport system ATPase subunit
LGTRTISFDVDQGEVVVLKGPSGTGKSMLLPRVNGLEAIPGDGITFERTKVEIQSKASLKYDDESPKRKDEFGRSRADETLALVDYLWQRWPDPKD